LSFENFEKIVKSGNIQKTDQFLQENHLDQEDLNDALLAASSEGDLNMVKFLMEKGANLHTMGNLCINSAIYSEKPDIIKFFLDYGIDIHYNNDTLIYTAIVEEIDIKIIRLLLQNGAKVYDGGIQIAASFGREDVVSLILQYYNQFPPEVMLIVYLNLGYLEKVTVLLKEKKADIHYFRDEALKIASSKGYIEIVKQLLNLGADVHADNDRAILLANRKGYKEIVELLRQAGGNLE
jgi:ankyrin repeat protein